MAESKAHEMIPSGSLDELIEFFDTHDMGEKWEQMPEVDFDVDIKSISWRLTTSSPGN